MNGPLGEEKGDVIVYGKVCLGAMSAFSFLSCDQSQSYLMDEILEKGLDDN